MHWKKRKNLNKKGEKRGKGEGERVGEVREGASERGREGERERGRDRGYLASREAFNMDVNPSTAASIFRRVLQSLFSTAIREEEEY